MSRQEEDKFASDVTFWTGVVMTVGCTIIGICILAMNPEINDWFHMQLDSILKFSRLLRTM